MNNKKRHYYNNGKNRNRQRFQSEKISINKVYDSNGPSGRQRGNASTLYEKYVTLARDAGLSGDRVLSENHMQHAEHYLRIVNSIQEQMQSNYQAMQESDHQTANNSENKEQIVQQPIQNASSEESKEAPVVRRKTYPFARRKQNEVIPTTTDVSNVIEEPKDIPLPVEHKDITEDLQKQSNLEEDNKENIVPVVKPKRVIKKRITPKKDTKPSSTTNIE